MLLVMQGAGDTNQAMSIGTKKSSDSERTNGWMSGDVIGCRC